MFERPDEISLADYWSGYFAKTFERDWTIETAPPLMAAHFGLAIAAAGPSVFDGMVLDAGCGSGRLARAVAALGADVIGIDGNTQMIRQHAKEHPQVAWEAIDLTGRWDVGAFDVVFMLEALQCLPLIDTLTEAWSHLSPGGRLVFTVPWSQHPINVAAHREHRGMFQVTGRHELHTAVRTACPEHTVVQAYALHLGADQRLETYRLDMLGDFERPPYRVLVSVGR
jgi:2-polyprenyl-3-methyl-5-hydroxy-6-metoxy-1,4-benzoquinol methylase